MQYRRWQDAFILMLGMWLLSSPAVFGYMQSVAAANAFLLGIALMTFALLAMADRQMWEEWVNAALALWLIASPFVLGFSDQPLATWTHIGVGLLIGVDALWMIIRATPDRRRVRRQITI